MFVKKALLTGIFLATPLAAHALNSLTINGTTYPGTVTSVNVTSTGVVINFTGTVSSGGTTASPTATATASPTATPVASTGACGDLPSGVVLAGDINLSNPGSQVQVSLARETKAFRFTATSDPAFFGQFDWAAVAGTLGINRIAWISQCPGSPGYTQTAAADTRCAASGTENTSVRFSQSAKRGYCEITPNATYYVNIKNATATDPTGSTCPSGSNCNVYRMIYTN
jgi:hypothetical protein